MPIYVRDRQRKSILLALTLSMFTISLVFTLTAANVARAQSAQITQISSDPFHNKTSQHMTEVEPFMGTCQSLFFPVVPMIGPAMPQSLSMPGTTSG